MVGNRRIELRASPSPTAHPANGLVPDNTAFTDGREGETRTRELTRFQTEEGGRSLTSRCTSVVSSDTMTISTYDITLSYFRL
jgi:hypothetical protein